MADLDGSARRREVRLASASRTSSVGADAPDARHAACAAIVTRTQDGTAVRAYVTRGASGPHGCVGEGAAMTDERRTTRAEAAAGHTRGGVDA